MLRDVALDRPSARAGDIPVSWHLRYAPHLGYRPPFEPLFAASVGSIDPVDHVKFAADCGFAGVTFVAARARTDHEQERVGRALRAHGLQAGCMLYTTFDQIRNTAWATDNKPARDWIAAELEQACAAAARIGSRQLAVLGGADPQRPIVAQHAALVQNLRFAAEIAARHAITLCLENLGPRSVPHMLLQHIADAHRIVKAVGHPSVRLIFDTSHVQVMDGDVMTNLVQCWEAVEIVQVADNPGRHEPGTGDIDFESVLRWLSRRGYRGLIELEHGWQTPGADSERRALETLRRLDACAASAGITPSSGECP